MATVQSAGGGKGGRKATMALRRRKSRIAKAPPTPAARKATAFRKNLNASRRAALKPATRAKPKPQGRQGPPRYNTTAGSTSGIGPAIRSFFDIGDFLKGR